MFPRFNRESNNAGAFRPLRCLLLAFLFFALTFALGKLVFEKGVATDLYSLAGDGGHLIGAVARNTANEIRVLCEDEERAAKCRSAFAFRETIDPARILSFFQEHGRGLLAEKTRALLENGEHDRIRRSVKRRDYTGMGLYPKSADPYYFLSDYVASLKTLMPKGLADGQVLLAANAKGQEAKLPRLVELAKNDGGIALSGAPFHAFLATEKSKREIALLGGFSLGAVILLGLGLFRSPRFILPTAAALAFGFICGGLAVFAVFRKPHVLTFLFGSTLIGLGVDYCYHTLAGTCDAKTLRRKLAAAFATTALAFSPLLFSSVDVLNQMAAFTIAGLGAVFLSTCCGIPRAAGTPRAAEMRRKPPRCGKFAGAFAVASFCAASCGVFRIASTNDPSHFYTPPPLLATGEKRVSGLVGGSGAFAVTSAPTLEEALEKEEAAGIPGVSRILPSMKMQLRNAGLVKAFSGSEGSGDFVALDKLPPSLRALADSMIYEFDGAFHLIAPVAENVAAGNGTSILHPRDELENMFAGFAHETRRLLALSFAAMSLALFAMFRRRAFQCFLPVAMAVAATAGTLSWMGEKLTFFHMLSFFVMSGIGLDYAIFLSSHDANSNRRPSPGAVVFVSFLTSLAGFGALAFTSFPPTRAMGLSIALGLLYSYLFSLAANMPRAMRTPPSAELHWARQTEQSAGKFRILFIWWIYRLLGKSAAKIVFVVPFLFIFPFCRTGRIALFEFYSVLGLRHHWIRSFRQMLGFAWTAIDKTDACTLRRNPPAFTVSGDVGWMKGGAFLISSHLGCIEVLPAMQRTADSAAVCVHAFQQMGHDAIFTRIFENRLSCDGFKLHAVEDIGVQTAVEMHDAIRAGDLVLMAGDRLGANSGSSRAGIAKHVFLGRQCLWPKGVFRFAKLMEAPVYAIMALKTGWNSYEIVSRRLGDDLLGDYAAFLEQETIKHPEQWFQFYRFFSAS